MNSQKQLLNIRPDNDRFRYVRLLNLVWAILVACVVAAVFLSFLFVDADRKQGHFCQGGF